MEPATAVAITTTLSKLISSGLATYKALQSDELDEADVGALKSLLDTGTGLVQLWRRGSDTRPGALHLALITRAFGTALARYWRSPVMLSKKKIEHCTKQAALKICDPNARLPDENALALLQKLTGHPLANPYYKALWEAFSYPVVGADGRIPESTLGEHPREFERHFRSAYVEALATPTGQIVRRWCLGLGEEKREVMRHILAEDMALWGQRHVFGNVSRRHPDDAIPFMALDDSYVEPQARYQASRSRSASHPVAHAKKETPSEKPDHEPRPILELIHDLLGAHRLVVVTADFGHGKSLTARRLTRDIAVAWLNAEGPAPENPFPVFIKCARDIRDPHYVHGDVVRRALWNAAGDSLDHQPAMVDDAFEPVESNRATLFVLDGLDEVSLTSNALEDLFRTLNESLGDRQRAVVFTRPGALQTRRSLPEQTPVIELLPFADEQIAVWAERWNRLSPRSQLDVSQIGDLVELARTPILLLMIAMTRNEHLEEQGSTSRTMLYERFFHHIARGKHAGDADEHRPIRDASAGLAEKLRHLGILDSDDPVKAMLWLMSRVAWEAHVLENGEQDKRLRTVHVEHLLEDELEFDGHDHMALVQMGLLLVLQVEPGGGAGTILFGHQSFREFLVARYWKHQLGLVIDRSTLPDLRAQAEENLKKARLMAPAPYEDKTFGMLIEMLQSLNASTRHSIRQWAQDYVNTDELNLTHRLKHKEHRIFLRESALAIGSALEPGNGLELNNKWALRALWIGFEFYENEPIISAPRLRHPQCRLESANLSEADLMKAVLSEADLSRANLIRANLSGANLVRATLGGADLIDADLSMADLSEAILIRATLRGATLSGAILSRANLSGANLIRATLRGAILSEADLRGADLSEADLSEATLIKAVLRGANLRGANLLDAKLFDAKLLEADLRRAELRGADLSGADLSEATLSGVTLSGVTLSGVNLRGANLRGANLRGTNLSGTNLSRANLSGANLLDADLLDADLSGVDLSGATLRGATLSGANLDGATVSRKELENAHSEGARGLDTIQEPPDDGMAS